MVRVKNSFIWLHNNGSAHFTFIGNYSSATVDSGIISAVKRLIDKVVQSRRRPLLAKVMIFASGTQFHVYLPWGQLTV